MKLRKLSEPYAAVEILYYIITIFVCGALYSLLFIGIAFPVFKAFVPDSDSKTLLMMFFYGLLGIILIVGAIALIRRGIEKNREEGW
jgi:nitrate reductase gamma subunit